MKEAFIQGQYSKEIIRLQGLFIPVPGTLMCKVEVLFYKFQKIIDKNTGRI
jgi:hypothetical protein